MIYIINKKILKHDELDSTLYQVETDTSSISKDKIYQLTPEQSAFYELHNCSLHEALNCELDEVILPTLNEVKAQRIIYFSDLAFAKRRVIYPDYKLDNAALGIYDAEETAAIKATVEAFRNEFYRLKALCESAETIEELVAIEANFNVNL